MSEALKAICFGRKIATRIIRDNPDSVMVFTNDRVGDTCIQLAWAKQFKEHNNIKRLVCVTTKSMAGLAGYFDHVVDDFYYISKEDLAILFKFYKSDIGLVFYRRHPELICTFMTAHVRNDIVKNPSFLNFATVTKAIYHLPASEKPFPVKQGDGDKARALIQSGVIVPQRTVLLNPNAKTIVQTPFSFFVEVAKRLQVKGYKVITSVHGDEPAIPETESIDFSLIEAIEIANACGFVVGARSGFLDLLAFSDARIISIDNDQYDYSDYFDILAWDVGNRIKNVMYCQSCENQIIDEIVDAIDSYKELL